MKRFEYHALRVAYGVDLPAMLNSPGAQGWELVGTYAEGPAERIFIFKREVEQGEWTEPAFGKHDKPDPAWENFPPLPGTEPRGLPLEAYQQHPAVERDFDRQLKELFPPKGLGPRSLALLRRFYLAGRIDGARAAEKDRGPG